MDSEQPIESDKVVAVSLAIPDELESETGDVAVEAGTESTTGVDDVQPVEEENVIVVTKAELKQKAVRLHRSNSAPSEEEESSDGLLSQEALEHAKKSPTPQVTNKSTSLSSVDPDVLPRQLSSLSEGEFEEFINSPRGQNVIVERSPGGRYVRFMEKLGSGASKDVYRAYDTTEGIEVAWNVVNLAGVPKAERNRIVNEVRLLERLHHHNIISFHGSWVNRERQEVNFVTEILSSGTLKSFIDKVQVIRWKIAKRWARQILAGLAYLHEQDPPVIHRDLKCDNIFINGTSGDLRIGDLGLSTVHRNGKVLSVLGTPEFMAPDLYEETCYDEKVDIYAFGMALLEIFTKDIPYRECANPAQIYRKVMRGDPPDSLARVRSKEARDFITLCLGYKDEECGKYVRPSAAELLNHPFLGTGADDDSEVKVDPPLMERTIREEASESPKGVTTKMVIPAPPQLPLPEASTEKPSDADSAPQQVHSPAQATRSPAPPRRDGVPPRPNAVYQARQNSLDDDSDHFDDMPDSEVNIKRKVKVMMGRGQELENTENEITMQNPIQYASYVIEPGTKPEESTVGSVVITEQVSPPQAIQPHYLVAAAVIEDESPLVRPYNDDILKLIIRLPVEGQTQNVQFDFHLIEDDPVQVAKEMVTELGIPQEAILEISETISGHARNARMRQEKHISRQQWQSDQQMGQNVQGQGMQQPGAMQQDTHNNRQQWQPEHQMAQNVQGQGMQQPGVMHQQSQHVNQNVQGQGMQQPQQPGVIQQQHMNQNVPIQGSTAPVGGNEGYLMSHPQMPHVVSAGSQQSLSHGQAPGQGQFGEGQHVPPLPQLLSSRSHSGGQMQQPMYGQPQDGNPAQQMQHAPQQHMMQQNQVSAHQPISHEGHYQGVNHVQYATAPSQSQQLHLSGHLSTQPFHSMSQPMPPSGVVSPPPPPEMTLPQDPVPPHDSLSMPLPSVHENGSSESSALASRALRKSVDSGRLSATDGLETNEEDDDDEGELKEEMRRLDEDFQKNMLRAQKVFDSRMDNLQRSKEEREAQHLKTLEKHEKERAEFEKRLQQAEKEQNRRIEQLQREWDKKRESLAKHKHKGAKKRPAAPDVPSLKAALADENLSELEQANAESLGTMASAASRERLVPPMHKKSSSMNNSESSDRSRSSSSTSLDGESGNNSDQAVT